MRQRVNSSAKICWGDKHWGFDFMVYTHLMCKDNQKVFVRDK